MDSPQKKGGCLKIKPLGQDWYVFNWVVFQSLSKIGIFPQNEFLSPRKETEVSHGDILLNISNFFWGTALERCPSCWIPIRKCLNNGSPTRSNPQSSCHPDSFSPVRYDLQDLRATCGAFCALRHDGHVVCWGSPSLGGARAMRSAPIVGRSLVSTLGAFGVLRRILELAAWVMNDPYNQP